MATLRKLGGIVARLVGGASNSRDDGVIDQEINRGYPAWSGGIGANGKGAADCLTVGRSGNSYCR